VPSFISDLSGRNFKRLAKTRYRCSPLARVAISGFFPRAPATSRPSVDGHRVTRRRR
jgi:hypothetical protein